eukprot:130540_1
MLHYNPSYLIPSCNHCTVPWKIRISSFTNTVFHCPCVWVCVLGIERIPNESVVRDHETKIGSTIINVLTQKRQYVVSSHGIQMQITNTNLSLQFHTDSRDTM